MKNIAKKVLMIVTTLIVLLSMSVTIFAEGETQKTQPNPTENLISMVVIYGGMIALFYFVFMRPQKKKAKQEEAMRNAIQVGDDVVMTSGIMGRVINIKDEEVTIETGAARTQIKFVRQAIARVEKKGEEASKEKLLDEKKAELQRKLDEKKKNKNEE